MLTKRHIRKFDTEVRKILVLGGADIQVTAIQCAKELGYHVITCDYLPDNPGHAYADEYFNVSTTDLEAVLDLADRCGIHGISAYGSDPAAVTAAYVAQELGLPGDPYDGVKVIQDKVGFRKVQADLGVPVPGADEAVDAAQVLQLVSALRHGAILKPVDTSGSKGIHRVTPGSTLKDVVDLLEDTRSFSRAKRVIVEEYLLRKSRQMTGDALIMEGQVRFWCFGDVHFNDTVNGLVPRGVTIPGSIPEEQVKIAMNDVQRIIDHLGLRQGVYNIDLFIDDRDRPIIVDIGARNGGNMLNTLYQRNTGVDLMELSLRMCMGEQVSIPMSSLAGKHFGHIVVHATRSGILRSISLSEQLEDHVFYRSFRVEPGDPVGAFINSNHRLGLLLVEFTDRDEMEDIYAHIHDHVRVELEEVEVGSE